MNQVHVLSVALILLGLSVQRTYSCTSLLFAPISSNTTGIPLTSSFVAYNADDSTGYGYMKFFPNATHPIGARRKIVDGDTQVVHGDIPEASVTCNVVHRTSENGITIGESTWEGLPALQQTFPGSIMDYESLIDIALQRATNALEAAGVITSLAELYGWVSLGESFNIADSNDAFLLEVIGKGTYGKGVVWAIQKIPGGMVTAHANQPRITTCTMKTRCFMHPDTIPLARKLGYTGTDEEFSFSDFFQPLDPATVRATEARVWSIFNTVTKGGMDEYLNYAKGWDLTKRMPLYVKPSIPITYKNLSKIMRDTYENTFFAFDNTEQYVGAGPYSAPYRPRPLVFEVEGKNYVNERPIGTQQTLTSHITEIRQDTSIPSQYRPVIWFSVDDTVLSARLPIYPAVSRVPPSFSFESGDVWKFNLKSAFWVFNLVANLTYSAFKYIAPTVQSLAQQVEDEHEKALVEMDNLLRQEQEASYEPITARIEKMGESLTQRWLTLWQELFMKYKDSYVLTQVPGQWASKSSFQDVPQSWYNRIVKESGDRFFIPSTKPSKSHHNEDLHKKL